MLSFRLYWRVEPNSGSISGRLKVVRIAIRNPKREDLRLRDGGCRLGGGSGDLYIQAAQELDEEKRKAIYQKRRALLNKICYIYLVAERLMAAVRDRVQGIRTLTLGALWNIHELKVTD